jgi:hypothetical protein
MSAITILSLKSVCEDYNIADDVVKIIMDYMKSHTFKQKINIQFLNGFNTMMEPTHGGYRVLQFICPQCPYEIMEDWAISSFTTNGFTDMGCMETIVDWNAIHREISTYRPTSIIPVGSDGRCLVSTITDFMETGGENLW